MYYNRHIKRVRTAPAAEAAPAESSLHSSHTGDLECFGDKAKPWIWSLAFLIAVVMAIGAGEVFQGYTKTPVRRYRWSNASPYTVAYRPCPWCQGGLLDFMGRCNIVTCPVYSAEFGKGPGRGGATAVALVPTESRLINELGVDVVTCQTSRGVRVEAVYPQSGAYQAGLQPGDIITGFNGRKVRNPPQFQRIVLAAKPGSSVSVEFVRGDGQAYRSRIQVGT